MTEPSPFDFVRNRAGVTWLVLVGATIASFVLGAHHATGAPVVVAVLGIAAFKVRLVGLDFMELRDSPLPLRLAFEAYCLALWVVLSVLYVCV